MGLLWITVGGRHPPWQGGVRQEHGEVGHCTQSQETGGDES